MDRFLLFSSEGVEAERTAENIAKVVVKGREVRGVAC